MSERARIPTAYASDMHPLGQSLYFLWRWLVFAPFTFVNTSVLTVVTLTAALFSENAAYRCTQLWARLQCLCNFTRVRITGLENKVPGRAYVVMSNHRSSFDLAILCLPWQSRLVMKAELKKIPVFGWACHAAGTAWVDRRDSAQAIASLQAMKPKLDGGASLLIYPEGTRSLDGSLGSFKKGGFRLALDLGIPILPVTALGAGKVWPPKTLKVLPGRIDYTVHPPIDPADFGAERIDELVTAVRAALLRNMPEEGN
ncbi:MAG: lysophospholipid acyltransferase family protein [Planctomycetota bacterium]